MRTPHRPLALLAALLAASLLPGCGGGYGHAHYVEESPPPPLGDVDVYNNTIDEVVVWFGVAPAGTPDFTDNLVPDLFPGEVIYAGSFYEDFYDAELDVEDPFGFVSTVGFYDVFVEAFLVTEFEVF